REVRPEYERNSPRMSSNSYVNLKIATCLVRYADDRLIDQRFPSAKKKAIRDVINPPSGSGVPCGRISLKSSTHIPMPPIPTTIAKKNKTKVGDSKGSTAR
ncbi:hypothetical protein, partial [Burkholderia contaminans]|uniref:hypothetical protein n=1 Tax=Burkholderia contaminans TaxID=488447 RepID=UPI002D80C81F